MRSPGFRRFVAIFVGVLLAIGWVVAIYTGDEGMFGSALAVTALYIVYLVLIVKKEKEQRDKKQKSVESPLLRR